MQSLTAYQVVQVWEWGHGQHAVDRALLLLAQAFPALPREQLANLTVGQRNRRLLLLRQMTFGDQLDGMGTCPACSEQLTFQIQVSELILPEPNQTTFSFSAENLHLQMRLPNSHDLAAIVGLDGQAAGRELLLKRCVLDARRGDQPLPRLPDALIPLLTDAVTEHDPQAEMRFALQCPACGEAWSALFDIVTFLWSEIDGRARRLSRDVHLLAQAYGWREVDILAMSATRRQLYLEWIGT